MASSHTYILVTGANIGLGFGICHRLIDDFLTTHPSPSELTLIFTTRSSQKGAFTLRALQSHLTKQHSSSPRIYLRPENVELTSLLSIRSLALKLTGPNGVPKLDAIILNAGIGGTTGIDFPTAIWQILTENVAAVTWPRFKLSAVGNVTDRQLDESESEQPLGQVFCANVFGHYMLAHWLMGLLRNPEGKGRVIWISSIEAGRQHFDEGDLQGLRSGTAYEASKRVTDLLALTAGQRPTEAIIRNFTAVPGEPMGHAPDVGFLLAHPGVVATSIVPLPPVLMSLWVATAYVMRWIGSPWHTNTAYNGSLSAVWLALASSDEIKEKTGAGTAKWGSVVDRKGNARVEKTDVQGWGIDGSGKPVKESWWGGIWGRTIGATDATGEDVEAFVSQGARVWREMEDLRVMWEERIRKYEEEH